MTESNATLTGRGSRGWVDGVKLVGDVGSTVVRARRPHRSRARWAVTAGQIAGVAGLFLLRRRYPRAHSLDTQLVSAAMKDARHRGELNVAEVRRDPAFRLARARLTRRNAWMVIYGVSALAAQRLLLAELKRRNVRRPHPT